jgi:hypothetical protein
MKRKFIFTIIIMLLFAACKMELPSSESDDPDAEDVIYDESWKFITVALGGGTIDVTSGSKSVSSNGAAQSGAARNTRAMTADSARRGFNFFEAVFYYNGALVGKTSWEIGKRAYTNVGYTTASGVDYSATSISQGGGCALLFAGHHAGNLQDKTLLAVGKLYAVDGVPGTLIKSNSVNLTFELCALEAQVSMDAAKSSFLLTGGEETKIINAQIGERFFPLYMLKGGKTGITAQYKFNIVGGWERFSGSLKTAGAGIAETREVRYPAWSGKYWYAIYALDKTTKVNMKNNQAAAVDFDNTVTFSFDTLNTINPIKEDNGIFSLTFKIPVYPVDAKSASVWYINPGYASYYYNIDNGIIDSSITYSDVNIGGAVLMGVDVPLSFEIDAERR